MLNCYFISTSLSQSSPIFLSTGWPKNDQKLSTIAFYCWVPVYPSLYNRILKSLCNKPFLSECWSHGSVLRRIDSLWFNFNVFCLWFWSMYQFVVSSYRFRVWAFTILNWLYIVHELIRWIFGVMELFWHGGVFSVFKGQRTNNSTKYRTQPIYLGETK